MFPMDLTLRLDVVVQIVVIAVGGIIVFQQMRDGIAQLRGTLKAQADRLSNVELELKEQTRILVAVARQDAEMTALDRRIALLEGRPNYQITNGNKP